ncbi:MAG: DUF3352 domain-containing protein [Acidobacteria bacterium]|nr:DUF3352 domain-containing protein [Acidobacteriota bacterium]
MNPAQTPANPSANPAGAKADPAAAARGAAREAASSPPAEVSIDNLFAAEAYAVYGEMRMIGQHVNSADFKQMLDPLRLSGALPNELQGLLDFITGHAEELTAARVALGAMPVRAGLPSAVVAVEMGSTEEARKLAPQLRATFARYGAGAQEEGDGAEDGPGARDPRRAARRGGRGAQKRQAGAEGRTVAVRGAVEQGSSPFQIRRAGRVVALSDQAFTFKSLRGRPAEMPLAGEPGFQAVRSRFATDTLFLYFNTTRMNSSTKRQMEEAERKYRRMEEERLRAEAAGVKRGKEPPRAVVLSAGVGGVAVTADDGAPKTHREITADEIDPGPADDDLPPELRAEMEKARAAHEEELKKRTPDDAAKAREAEQRREFENQLGRMVFAAGPEGGAWPDSIGVGASFEGDAVVVRAFLLSESEDAPLRPVPFLPILHAGPQIASEAASVLPADTDILISASVDLQQMYDYVASLFKLFDLAASSPDKQGIFDSQVGAFEREYKFRIREDLLKALGNEIAIALPSEMFGVRGRRAARAEAAKGAPQGAGVSPSPPPPPSRSDAPVVVISLNDKRAMQELLPRALEAAGIKGLNAQQLLEKRGQAEMVTFAQGSVAFIDRFLVIAFDPAAMNHVVEAYNAGETLSAADEFRDPTGWQPKQGLGRAYVSNALTKGLIGDVRKDADDVDDETLRNLVARLDPNPGAVTLAATKDGGLMYELHVPKNLLSLWSISGAISQQLAPVRAHEGMAGYELRRLAGMQNAFKGKHGHYASLEELKAEMKEEEDGPGTLAAYEARLVGYEIKISASGDRFEATATPAGYPKQGRRSFYIDQTGVLRGADLGGRPATAATEPVVR